MHILLADVFWRDEPAKLFLCLGLYQDWMRGSVTRAVRLCSRLVMCGTLERIRHGGSSKHQSASCVWLKHRNKFSATLVHGKIVFFLSPDSKRWFFFQLHFLLFSSLCLLACNYSGIQPPTPSQAASLPLNVSQLKLYGSLTPLFLCKDNEQAPLCDFVDVQRFVSLDLRASRGPKDSDVLCSRLHGVTVIVIWSIGHSTNIIHLVRERRGACLWRLWLWTNVFSLGRKKNTETCNHLIHYDCITTTHSHTCMYKYTQHTHKRKNEGQ